jgi:maltose/moltooligosaccharide transporter
MDGCWFTMDFRCWEQHCYGAYRAFIADTLDEEQQPLGFQAQSFFTVSVSFSVYIHWNFPLIIVGYTEITQLDVCLFLHRAILSITSIWWSMSKTTEIRQQLKKLNI